MNRQKISIFSLITFIASISLTQLVNAATFTDVKPTDWFYKAVEELVAQGAVNDNFTTYRPADPANRAEAAMLIYNALDYKSAPVTPATPTFKDVPKDFWGYAAIETLAKNGIISGMKDEKGNPTGYFNPGDLVTREQFTKMITLAAPFTTNILKDAPHFSDVPADRWSYSFIETAYSWEAIQGYPDGKFYPERTINRAEMAHLTVKAVSGDMIVEPKTDFIEDAAAIDTNMVEVCFSFEPTEGLLKASSYSIQDTANQELKVSAVQLAFDPMCVTLTTDQHQPGVTYSLKIYVPAEMGSGASAMDETEFRGMLVAVDPPLYYLTDVTAQSEMSVEACFEMEVDDNFTSPSTYEITNEKNGPFHIFSVVKSQEDPKCLLLTTYQLKPATKYTLAVTLKDEEGNEIFSDNAEFEGYMPSADETALTCVQPVMPAEQSVMENQTNVQILSFNCTTGYNPLLINTLTLNYAGDGNMSDFNEISLYRDNIEIPSPSTIDEQEKTVTLDNLNIKIPADTLAQFTLKANIHPNASSAVKHQWEFQGWKDMLSGSFIIAGNFPLKGDVITVK